MNEKKKILRVLIILLMVLLVIIILFQTTKKNKKSKTQQDFPRDEEHISFYSTGKQVGYNEISSVTDRNSFFTIESCVNTYIEKIVEKDSDAVYKLLDESYIKEKGITKNNVLDKVGSFTGNLTFIAQKMNYQKINDMYHRYYIEGDILEGIEAEGEGDIIERIEAEDIEEEKYKGSIKVMVNVDLNTTLFSIIPEEKENNLNIENKINGNNMINHVEFDSISGNRLLNKYLSNYRAYMMCNVEKSYELLDKDYREKKFKNLDEYKKFIEKNKYKIMQNSIEAYTQKFDEDEAIYICEDSYGGYIIIKEKAIMDYTIMLDNYTTDIDYFTKLYDENDEYIKAKINAQKVINAINQKDYQYIYEKLDDTFKQNNYNTYEKFEEFMNNTFNDNYRASITNTTNQASMIICNVYFGKISSYNPKGFTMQIIMKLKEDRDFVMSFNIR